MSGPRSTALHELEVLYHSSTGDLPFERLLARIDVGDDAALAELIEIDGRNRIARGQSIELHRYLSAVSDLRNRQDPLDAAIDVTLRSMSGSSRAFSEVIGDLIVQYPDLEKAIRESAALNGTMCSTTGVRAGIDSRAALKPLPSEFGPLIANGLCRYQLQRLLGRGGFGQVYLALDRQLSEADHTALVAIKILTHNDRSPWGRERVIEEATKARRISHPNVVMVMDRGISDENEDFIVYEYVDGGDLSQLAGTPLPTRKAAQLVAKIARGIHAAHSAGVIHCDLKPGNIMLTKSCEPKVADFGIAVRVPRATPPQHSDRFASASISGSDQNMRRNGTAENPAPIGNIAFISPEQYRGEDRAFSVQSDVYALGGILFLLLTGHLPNGATPQEIARNHDARSQRTEPPMLRPLRAQVHRDLEAICRRAMAVKPEDRYDSAAALADDLERWIRNEPLMWLRPSLLRVLGLWARRKPALAASLAIIVLLAISGSATALHLSSVANRNAIEAAINKTRAEQEEKARLEIEKIRKRSEAMAQRVADILKPKAENYRFSTDALAYIWVLEYVFGPSVFGMPDQQHALWENRIANIRNLVTQARLEGREDDLETMLWETALAFWLVSAKDYLEAEPLARHTHEKLIQRIAPHDPWLKQLQLIQSCAQVNRAVANIAEHGASDLEQLRSLQQSLLKYCDELPSDRRGTPLHYLALTGLADLCGPNLLNDVAELQRVLKERETLLKHSVTRK